MSDRVAGCVEYEGDKICTRKIPNVHKHKLKPGDLLSDRVARLDIPDDDAVAIFVSSERGQQRVLSAEGQVDHLKVHFCGRFSLS